MAQDKNDQASNSDELQQLEQHREDAADRFLTTNQGVRINDNQNSLKSGERGATLLEDFILREKITHFDHERIPERIVHARAHTDIFRFTSRWRNTRGRNFCRTHP
jgi:catalase